jgi:hypothetical protein
MQQRLLEVAVLFEESLELIVLVGRVATNERERRGQNGQTARQHDQVVAHIERDVYFLAAFGLGLALLLADALADPEAEAVYGQAEDDGEYVEDGVSAHHFDARFHAAERVEYEACARREYGHEDEGD